MKYTNIYSNTEGRVFDQGLRDYMYLIYKNMGIALLISAIVSIAMGHNSVIMGFFLSNPLVYLLVEFSPVIFYFTFYKTFMNGTAEEARNKLIIYSILIGASFSIIFLIYAKETIMQAFLTSAITFSCMSLYGYTTKKDLSSLTSFIVMGCFGCFIAAIINLFIRSSFTSFVISCVYVLILTLDTAFRVQNLREMYNQVSFDNKAKEKIAVFGALELYSDFVYLFIHLLNILGSFSGDRK